MPFYLRLTNSKRILECDLLSINMFEWKKNCCAIWVSVSYEMKIICVTGNMQSPVHSTTNTKWSLVRIFLFLELLPGISLMQNCEVVYLFTMLKYVCINNENGRFNVFSLVIQFRIVFFSLICSSHYICTRGVNVWEFCNTQH